jgi:hypothetical protein
MKPYYSKLSDFTKHDISSKKILLILSKIKNGEMVDCLNVLNSRVTQQNIEFNSLIDDEQDDLTFIRTFQKMNEIERSLWLSNALYELQNKEDYFKDSDNIKRKKEQGEDSIEESEESTHLYHDFYLNPSTRSRKPFKFLF